MSVPIVLPSRDGKRTDLLHSIDRTVTNPSNVSVLVAMDTDDDQPDLAHSFDVQVHAPGTHWPRS